MGIRKGENDGGQSTQTDDPDLAAYKHSIDIRWNQSGFYMGPIWEYGSCVCESLQHKRRQRDSQELIP